MRDAATLHAPPSIKYQPAKRRAPTVANAEDGSASAAGQGQGTGGSGVAPPLEPIAPAQREAQQTIEAQRAAQEAPTPVARQGCTAGGGGRDRHSTAQRAGQPTGCAMAGMVARSR
eukprot:3513699-Alexandrium_andersonii.AAC.1